MDTRLLSIVGLLLVIFIAAMLANSGIVGYSATGSLKEYPYEGFAQIKESYEARDEERKYAEAFSFDKIKKALSPAKGSLAGTEPFDTDRYKKVVMGGYNRVAKALKPTKVVAGAEAFGPMNSTTSLHSTPQDESPAMKVVGFKGVQSGAYGDEKIIGFMYNNESNTSCKPYGYTNSKGNICLSPEDIRLLTTRGGNALGVGKP
jgi:hypothetical protein